MADNVNIKDAAEVTVPVAADDISGVQVQRVKLMLGANGTNDGDLASGNPMPIGAPPTLPLPSGAATEATSATRLAEATFTARVGEVQASPTANTLLGRLKDLLTGIILGAGTNRIGKVILRNAADSADVTPTTPSDTQPISATSLPLPSGASTAAKQPAIGTAGAASADVLTFQGIAGMTPVKVDGSATTQPISGTITANAGTNLNTSLLAVESGGNLALIKAKTDNLPAQGQAAMAASLPVVIASNQSSVTVAVGAALPAGTNNIGDVDIVSLPNEGQQSMANSISVAVASDQSALSVTGPLTDTQLRATAVPVSASSLPLPSGAATSANQLPPSAVGHGRKTVTAAGTAEAIAGSTTCKRVIVQAMFTNAMAIAVGASGVIAATGETQTGVILMPGASEVVTIDNLSKVFVDAESSGEGVTYRYEN